MINKTVSIPDALLAKRKSKIFIVGRINTYKTLILSLLYKCG